MENIIDFEVDKNSDSYKIFKDIKKAIDTFSDYREISLLCSDFSNLTNCSSSAIKLKLKNYYMFNFQRKVQ